jgi:hypothetical protein
VGSNNEYQLNLFDGKEYVVMKTSNEAEVVATHPTQFSRISDIAGAQARYHMGKYLLPVLKVAYTRNPLYSEGR